MQACDIKLDVTEPKGLIESFQQTFISQVITFILRTLNSCLLGKLGLLEQLHHFLRRRGKIFNASKPNVWKKVLLDKWQTKRRQGPWSWSVIPALGLDSWSSIFDAGHWSYIMYKILLNYTVRRDFRQGYCGIFLIVWRLVVKWYCFHHIYQCSDTEQIKRVQWSTKWWKHSHMLKFTDGNTILQHRHVP